ncbi:MAG: hypothetical protein RBR07_07330 [Arcobacteraceae bacterium]|nr:hypothetical protein [Arcobacteraceae bacterium]
MIEKIYNYILVDEYIATAGQPQEHEFEYIANCGYEIVINLTASDKTLHSEDIIVSKYNMTYLHIPVEWENPTIESMNLFMTMLENLNRQKKRIFIHCVKNYRVSMFIYKYKKDILNQKDVVLIIPDNHIPSQAWDNIL